MLCLFQVTHCDGLGNNCANFTDVSIELSHNFTGLSPATKYTFKVLGFTSKGNGPANSLSTATDEYSKYADENKPPLRYIHCKQ